jgi:hypothetical protein
MKQICDLYSHDKCNLIVYIYVACFLIWTYVIYIFKLFRYKAWPVLMIPYIAFIISLLSISKITEDQDTNMTKASYLSMGVVLMIPVINWITNEIPQYSSLITGIFIMSLCFSLVTFIDIWLPRDYMSLYYHFRSTFQVMSVTLLIYSLTIFFMHRKTRLV